MNNTEENSDFTEDLSENKENDENSSSEGLKNNLENEFDITRVELRNTSKLRNQESKKRLRNETTSESYFNDNFTGSEHASFDLEIQTKISKIVELFKQKRRSKYESTDQNDQNSRIFRGIFLTFLLN